MSAPTHVAVLGAGIMGAPMARNLARAGFAVSAWNRTPEKLQSLTSVGIHGAASAREAVVDAHCVIVMLSTGAVCDHVLFDGDEAVCTALKAGATVIMMSSISVESAHHHAQRLASLGVHYVDAPVSGGEGGARDGSLSIMAGGAEEDIQRVRPVLEAMGRVTHVGPVGAGQLAKLANQLIVGVTIGAVAEAMLLVEAGGGDPRAVHLALQGGFADSTIWRQHGQRILDQNFQPGGHASTQLKDLATIETQAAACDLTLPFAALARALYQRMCEEGRAQLDHSGLYLFLKDHARSS